MFPGVRADLPHRNEETDRWVACGLRVRIRVAHGAAGGRLPVSARLDGVTLVTTSLVAGPFGVAGVLVARALVAGPFGVARALVAGVVVAGPFGVAGVLVAGRSAWPKVV